MNKLWLVVRDIEKHRTWWKYFISESEMDKFKNKIKYIKNLFIIEDSGDIISR
mgnify:CR=1 FL=1